MVATDVKDRENEEEEQEAGHIIIEFKQFGSVFFDVDFDGVVPMQMIAIGEYLSTLGKSKLLQEQARAQQVASEQKIQIAQPGVDPGALPRGLKK